MSYDGRNFHGVQKNKRTQDGTELRTIMSILESSLWPALDQRVKIRVASRTDAGVSATGQVVCFDAESAANDDELIRVHGVPLHSSELTGAFNKCLPPDLQLRDVEIVPRSFDVGDCKWKRYRYRLPAPASAADDEGALRLYKMVAQHAARTDMSSDSHSSSEDGGAQPSRRKRRRTAEEAARVGLVDVDAMARAAAKLQGTHDFAAFQARGGDQRGTVRTIFRCALETAHPFSRAFAHPLETADSLETAYPVENGVAESEQFDLVIEGDGFLYKMVRILAGTLCMVGMGLASEEIIPAALNEAEEEAEAAEAATGSGRRRLSKEELRRHGRVGPTLPPERLCLEHIEYERAHDVAALSILHVLRADSDRADGSLASRVAQAGVELLRDELQRRHWRKEEPVHLKEQRLRWRQEMKEAAPDLFESLELPDSHEIEDCENDHEFVLRAVKEMEWLLEQDFCAPSKKHAGLREQIVRARTANNEPLPKKLRANMQRIAKMRNLLAHDRNVNAIPNRQEFMCDWRETLAELSLERARVLTDRQCQHTTVFPRRPGDDCVRTHFALLGPAHLTAARAAIAKRRQEA